MSQEKVPVLLTEANKNDEKALQRISDSLKGFKNETVVEATELVASEVSLLPFRSTNSPSFLTESRISWPPLIRTRKAAKKQSKTYEVLKAAGR